MSFLSSSQFPWDRRTGADDQLSNLDTSRASTNAVGSGSAVRSKSANFLDNLLADDSPEDASRAKKNVRFGEEARPERESTSDWLGILDSGDSFRAEEESAALESKEADNGDNWLSTGLRKRQQLKLDSGRKERTTGEDETIDQERMLDRSEATTVKTTDDSNEGVALVLKAKISILEMEKEHLKNALDQTSKSHDQQISSLKSLHEQRIETIKQVFEKQESILIQERDRRMAELQTQLVAAEQQMADDRSKSSVRLQSLDSEWKQEVQRVRANFESSLAQQQEQHESNLALLRRQQQLDLDAMQASRDQLEQLVRKWQTSGDRLSQLLDERLTQERQHIQADQELGVQSQQNRQSAIELEQRWNRLSDELERQRDRDEQLRRSLLDALDSQSAQVGEEREALRRERQQLDKERKQLQGERAETDRWVQEVRAELSRETVQQGKRAEELNSKTEEVERRRVQQNDRESRWRVEQQRQATEQADLQKRLDDLQIQLREQQRQLDDKSNELQLEASRLHERKTLFDQERKLLQELADTIAKRSGQLERLNEQTSQERVANESSMDSLERLRTEVDENLALLESQMNELRKRETLLSRQSELVYQEWKDVQELRETIRCTLCATALKHANYKEIHAPDRLHLLAGRQSDYVAIDDDDEDRSLLVWQLSAQQEAALLEQETAFMDSIRKG